MAAQLGSIDLTNLIAAVQAMTEVINQNSGALAMGLTEALNETNTTLTEILTAGRLAAGWLHIPGAGTVSAAGAVAALLSVNINTPAAGATATIYDGANIIAIVALDTAGPAMIPMGTSNRGLKLSTGLTVTTTGTADITVAYV